MFLVLKLLVTLPITSCIVEHMFSKLKLIKTKLRTTMLQDYISGLMKILCKHNININSNNVIVLLTVSPSLSEYLNY